MARADNVSSVTVIEKTGYSEVVGTPTVTVLEQNASGYVTEASGATVPTAGDAGYAVGCRFTQTDGIAGSVLYINEGSTSSADFAPIGGGLRYAEVSLTANEIKALRATPKTLVAAPGSGKLLEFVSAVLLLDATATAFTESDDNMAIKYTDGSGAAVSGTIEATGFIDQTADTMTTAVGKLDTIVAKSGCENKALVLHNTGDGEYATGTGTMRVKIAYRVVSTGW